MQEQPLVSIAIPCYNHEVFIQEAIRSVIDQDYINIELIIIDDGSKDGSVQKIKEMVSECEKRFSRFVFKTRDNKGLSATLNEIVGLSNGFYFSTLASDDVIKSTKISSLVETLEGADEQYCVAFGDAGFIDNDGKLISLESKSLRYGEIKTFTSFLDYATRNRSFEYTDEFEFGSFKTLITGNYLPAMSYIVKINSIKEVGLWTIGNTIEDWEIWLNLSKKYKFKFLNHSVAFYRLHDSNTIKTMRKNLIVDGVKLLNLNKKYAVENDSRNEFFSTLADYIFLLIKYDPKFFVSELISNFFSVFFWKAAFLRAKLLVKLYFVK